MPYELLYGRAGFLWAALFLNYHVGEETIPWSVTVSFTTHPSLSSISFCKFYKLFDVTQSTMFLGSLINCTDCFFFIEIVILNTSTLGILLSEQ